MSSIPSPRNLESFVEDGLCNPTAESISEWVAKFEAVRSYIESAMEDYDSDTQSWRDYRNAVWDTAERVVTNSLRSRGGQEK